MANNNDINKDTIMNMLRTDVFGFKPQDIESKAEELFHLVSGTNITGIYNRSANGFVIIKAI